MGKKEIKTNAMRILDRMGIAYSYETYACDEFTDGIAVADLLGYRHDLVYKTLVATGKSGGGSAMCLWRPSKKRSTLRKRRPPSLATWHRRKNEYIFDGADKHGDF